ncbi:hypothetical protein RhiJN_13250 [Ceratobasidium sp. AG-Ba]|nr:hypothetical protein RhiJN_13250 [Ceratobasidium sp. AG-Ba]
MFDRKTGLPWGAARHYALQEKKQATTSLKRKAAPAPNPPASSSALKKQKVDSSGFDVTVEQLAVLSTEAKQLLVAVAKSEEKTLKRTLVNSIIAAGNSPSDIAAYRKLLNVPTTGAQVSQPPPPPQTRLHCVRCHASYLQSENTSTACKVAHEEPDYLPDDASDDYPAPDDEGEDEYGDNPMYKFPCCGLRLREQELDYGGEEWCVEESHTTDPTKVEYFVKPKGGAKKQKAKVNYRLDYYSRYKNKNHNVITCKEKKCPKA